MPHYGEPRYEIQNIIMRRALAEKLLIEIMSWTTKEVNEERPLLQALSSFKYNEYQQFSIGTLFMESLVKWLSKFETLEEKKIAYDFIKNQLIFFSNNQILHLVNNTFDVIIQPLLLAKTAQTLDLLPYDVTKIILSKEYVQIARKSLYIGLSDGAKIDQLRRSSKLNNEQVIPTYEVSEEKIKDMLKELRDSGSEGLFNTIFLVDDFTASGTSYFRKDEDKWNGKIYKTITRFFDPEKPLSKLINPNVNIDIHLIFYIASKEAIDKIVNLTKEALSDEIYQKLSFHIHTLQKLEPILKDDILANEKKFVALSKKYIDQSIVDKHWVKANHEKYYLGYNECCLPVVLGHNTPNNSLPLLWWISEQHKFMGLFPRITRHS